MKNNLKSIGAVIGGFAAIFILTTIVDTILENTGVFPTIAEQQKHGFTEVWMQLVALGYRVVFGIVGGYLVAKLAPSKPAKHVMALIILNAVIGTLGSIVAVSAGILTVWFSVSLVVLSVPSIWMGGKLATKK